MIPDEATYLCDHCGEEIVVPIDVSQGQSQEFTEDCPVCCHPNVVCVSLDDDGSVSAWASSE
ncbi:MAG: CPXCG motif-containing cysteine-rich protein [Planctomycetaceae bacterium]